MLGPGWRVHPTFLLWIFFVVAALSFTGYTAQSCWGLASAPFAQSCWGLASAPFAQSCWGLQKNTASLIQEGADFTSSKYYDNGEWMPCCLDISNNVIRDYPTFYKIRDYLSNETSDIQSRYHFKYNIGSVVMAENFLHPKFPEVQDDPESEKSVNSVAISGQIPSLTFHFNYPAPMKGRKGDRGDVGPDGERGEVGMTGKKGPLGYQSME